MKISDCAAHCENDRRLHFGLGQNPQIEKAEIRWPDGRPIQTVSALELDKMNAITEPH